MTSENERESWFRPAEPLPDNVLLQWTTRLEAGEKGHKGHGIASAILGDFCVRAWTNKPQSRVTLSWLAEILSDIVEEGTPDARRAFGLTPRREGGASKAHEARDIAVWVKCATDRGYTVAEAVNLAANVFHKDPKQIRRQRNRAQERADGINPQVDWGEIFKAARRPLPPFKRGTRTR